MFRRGSPPASRRASRAPTSGARRAYRRRSAGGRSGVGPGGAGRRRRGAVESGPDGEPERVADGADRLGTEAVRPQPGDAAVLFLEPEDDLECLVSPPGREPEQDGLTVELVAFEALAVRPRLPGPLLVSVHHLVQELGQTLGLGP